MIDKKLSPLEQLKQIGEILRSETGCPWDKEQTISSLKPYLIEESYEVYDAIERNNMEDLKEELGDLLYQIYAQSQIASEQGDFTIEDVAQGIGDKLVRRHPHVFGEESLEDSSAVKNRWEEIKREERNDKGKKKSILDGVPNQLPALVRAYRIQEKVSHIGFDWANVHDAMGKLDEELREFKEVVAQNDEEKMVDEAGDILFSIVNILRHQKIDPEEALRKSASKFRKRFMYIEEEIDRAGKNIHDVPLNELDRLWDECKEKFE